jgi:hypothetical protein
MKIKPIHIIILLSSIIVSLGIYFSGSTYQINSEGIVINTKTGKMVRCYKPDYVFEYDDSSNNGIPSYGQIHEITLD